MTRPRRILAAVVLAWLAAAVILVFRGIADGELVCDDGYYYFEIARNAARGEGFTFDGLRPTNGFHPLWAWLLVPVYAAFPSDPWTPIHVAVSLSALFTAATAVAAFALFERHGRSRAGLLAAGLWLLNPYTWVLAGRGMEGPLHTLAIAVTLVFLDRIRRRSGLPTVRQAAGLGALLGLSLLARTDSVFLVAAAAIALVGDGVRSGQAARLVSRVGACAAAAGVVIAPWVLWNLATFGTVVQTSFRAKHLFHLYGQLPPLGEGVAAIGGALRNLWLVAVYNAKYIAGEEWTAPRDGWWVLGVAAVLAAGLALAPLLPRLRPRPCRPSLVPVGLFCAIHFAWYAWIGLNYYNWYFLPPVLAFCLFAGDRLARIAWAGRAGRSVALAIAAGIALTAPWLTSRHLVGDQRLADERLFERDFAPRLAATAPGERAGAWNAGLVGYFASFRFPDRIVINLDGLVNNDVPRAAAEGRYERYLLENVDRILEPPDRLLTILPPPDAMRFVERHVTADGRVVRD